MILKFAHKGLERFYATGSKARINPQHAERLSRQLSFLDNATKPKDVDVPGWKLHPLTGDLIDYHSIAVNGN
jgi:toxin HigB-1